MKLIPSLAVISTVVAVCQARSTTRLQRKTNDIFAFGASKIPLTSRSKKKSKKTPKLDCNVKHKKKSSSSSKGKTRSPTTAPAPTISPAPTRSGKGKSSREDCPTMVSACSLLETGQATFGTFNYVVDMKLAITAHIVDVLETLQEFLEDELGESMSGCYDFDVRRRRRLEETGIMKIDVDTTHDTTPPCTETLTGATCENVDINLQVTHDEGDPDAIRTALLNAVVERCDAIGDLPGISKALDPCDSITISGEESQDGNDTGGSDGDGNDGTDGSTTGDDEDGTGTTQDGGDSSTGQDGEDGTDGGDSDEEDNDNVAASVQARSSEERVQARGYISMALAIVLLLILLILVVRRRREYAAATMHKYLVDDGGEDETDTYLKDSDADSQDMQARQVHVVGEADSVFSGWTGFTGDRRNNITDYGGLYPDQYNGSYEDTYLNQDVHKCSSATCEVCEQKRRAGIQFVPAQMPGHSSAMPSNASRHYETGDTVTL